ncbi:MAG: Uma2 family endonuclease [Sandaracinus sp.]
MSTKTYRCADDDASRARLAPSGLRAVLASGDMEARDLRRMSVEDYLALDASSELRWELVDGEVFELLAARVEHNLVVANLSSCLVTALRERPCVVLGSQQRVARSDRGFFYPDVVVVCGPVARHPKDDDTITNPTLLVEVLSPSTADYDRSHKFDHYRAIDGLDEILFVSIELREIERRRRMPNGDWISSWFTHGPIELRAAGVSVRCEDVFAKLPA